MECVYVLSKLKFMFFSILGFVFFIVPISINGETKIATSHIVSLIKNNFLDEFIFLTLILSVAILFLSIFFVFYTSKNDYINSIFKKSYSSIILRILGSAMYIITVNNYFNDSKIISAFLNENTGGVMVGTDGLLTTLYITFFVGIILLPLLTHFGLVEFMGILMSPIVQKLFKVPGYATIDAITSFVGSGTIGILVTDSQYQRGYYNKREAYIIATSFSIVGIAFASAVAEELGFGHIFPIFYGAIILTTLLIALIISRMTLKKFPRTYYNGVEPNKIDIPSERTRFEYAVESASIQAQSVNIKDMVIFSLKNIINVYINFLPIIMLVGTFSLVMAEYTNLFNIISYPFVYIYQIIGYSKEVATKMAPASVVGFADMYLPAIFITTVESESARFFIGVLSFTQLIFMSETGIILMESKIGFSLSDIIKLFFLRTLISIPILIIITNVLVKFNIISF